MSLSFYFLSLFLFLSPKLFPFHSIGTREVVTQKNLSGLVPIRDLRLDPSLLCSIPLLALSPNLLIVWLFLSIAYLVTKLRCKWVSLWKINKSQENKSARIYLTGQKECVKARLPRNISCLTVGRFVVLNYKYLPNCLTRRTCCLTSAVFSACSAFLPCPVAALFSWSGIICTKSLIFWCKAIHYLYITCALFPRERNSVWKNLYIWYYPLNVLLIFPFLLKRNDKKMIDAL